MSSAGASLAAVAREESPSATCRGNWEESSKGCASAKALFATYLPEHELLERGDVENMDGLDLLHSQQQLQQRHLHPLCAIEQQRAQLANHTLLRHRHNMVTSDGQRAVTHQSPYLQEWVRKPVIKQRGQPFHRGHPGCH